MAIIGLSHTFLAGEFGSAALDAIYQGFQYCTANANLSLMATNEFDTTTHHYWGSAGSVFGQDGDDAAFFGIYNDGVSLTFLALRGFDLSGYSGAFPGYDVENYSNPVSSYSLGDRLEAGRIHVKIAVDDVEGTWFIVGHDLDNLTLEFLISGVRSRRYPADGTTDNICRFGLFVPSDNSMQRFMLVPQYGFAGKGLDHFTQGRLDTSSPLGNGPVRGAALTGLGKVVAPIYPMSGYISSYGMTAAAALMGEFTSVMSATDAYANEEEVAPGWVAYGSDSYGMLAYRSPAPTAFVELDTVLL